MPSPSSAPSGSDSVEVERLVVGVVGELPESVRIALTESGLKWKPFEATSEDIDVILAVEGHRKLAAKDDSPPVLVVTERKITADSPSDVPADVTGRELRFLLREAVRTHRLERTLVETRELLERTNRNSAIALEASGTGTWRRDLRTGVVEWSPQLMQIFGLPPSAFGGTEEAFLELVHPDDRKAVSIAVETAVRNRTAYEVEFRYRHHSGEYRWMTGRGSASYDGQGDPIELAGVGFDITDRKGVENELRARDTILSQVGENLPDGALYQVLATPDGNRQFKYFGPGVERLTGVPQDEALRDASSLYKLIHPDDLPVVAAAERRCIADGILYNVEVRLQHCVTGEWRWVQLRSNPKDLPDGSRVWNGIYMDITERKRTEEDLARAVARLDFAQSAGHVGVFDWDIPSGLTTWSNEEQRLFGMEPGTFEGSIEGWARRVHPEDLPRMQQLLQDAMARKDPEMGFSFRIIHGRTGGIRWLEGTGRFTYAPDGTPLRMVGVNYDVTERLEVQQQLAVVNRELRLRVAELEAVARVLPVGIAIGHDPACSVVTGNQALERMLGVSHGRNVSSTSEEAEKLAFKFYRDGQLVPGDDLPLQQAARTGKAVPAQELEARFTDGHTLHLLVNAAPIVHDDGTPQGAVAALVDIGDAKRAQKALVDADRRKNEFLAMLSHELRNPLAAIRNALHVLETAGNELTERVWAKEVIERQSGQLTRLVDDLLDVARITRGKVQLRPVRLDAAEVLDHAVESVRNLVAERSHQLRALYPRDGSLVVMADPSRLEQIVVNLLTNAAKYTEPGGEIALEAIHEGGEIVISVRDTGMGISADKLSDVFELFTQGERTIDRSEGGLGLGLTIVRQLAEMHGGHASAWSEGLARGSTFLVRLPATDAPAPATARAKAPLSPQAVPSARILVIEDNVDSAHGLAKLLARRGYLVEVAYDGPSGLEKARSFRPDIMLVDLGLPGMTGYEVAAHVRSVVRVPSVFLVAISGYGQEEDRIRTRAAGFDHHLVKPVAFEVLEKLLQGFAAN